jgi:hypothetical protein
MAHVGRLEHSGAQQPIALAQAAQFRSGPQAQVEQKSQEVSTSIDRGPEERREPRIGFEGGAHQVDEGRAIR